MSAGVSVKEENILTLKLKLTLFFCGFEYEHFTLAFSSHSNPHSRCFLGVKEENILTLKLKLTLFFVSLSTNASLWPFLQMLQRRTGSHAVFFSVKEENILTLKLKLTLFFWKVLSENLLSQLNPIQ